MSTTTARYGTWASPLTAARATAGSLRFDHLVCDGDDVHWVEGRASEGGRCVVVRRTPDGVIRDVTPAGFNVRSRVHEYGGAAYTVHHGTVFFSNFADQRLYRQSGASAPEPLTREGCFYADCHVDERRARLVCVREDHTRVDREPVNTLAAIEWSGGETVLAEGADFYSDPTLSPDGCRLAWLQWNHPNMPWDGTELWSATISASGTLVDPFKIAGGPSESIFQPAWSADGRLYFVSDRTGWWNLYRTGAMGPTGAMRGAIAAAGAAGVQRGERGTVLSIEAVYPMAAEFGRPQWTFSESTFAFLTADRLVATYNVRGRWKMALIDTEARRFEELDLRLEPTDGVVANSRDVFFIGGSPTEPQAVVRLTIAAAEAEILRISRPDRGDPAHISVAEPITFRSADRDVHAFYYPPTNPGFTAPAGERPPLLVLSHGGPTSAAEDVLDERLQYWTSRGFAVVDVNYSGSSGFGREYRDRLKRTWGVADVADCVNAARHLVTIGRADPARLAIRGGSAGGYTTLAALTFFDVFRAGASYYGISDIEVLARDTHKFESRYLDSLIGPYPAARETYRQRSPIHFTDRVNAALILFQGLEDKVVPPNQSAMMAAAVRAKGLPVAYVTFEGEQHGFRKGENIVRSMEAELYFYGAVFGFTPADTIQPVAIDNLR
jgi:dipeptidyl aminopeptidase/acylaminoacyl peptidase